MKKTLVASAECLGEPVRYYLLCGAGGYGIGVEYRGEEALIPGLCSGITAAKNLLERMVHGNVTPATARDIAEDWLCK